MKCSWLSRCALRAPLDHAEEEALGDVGFDQALHFADFFCVAANLAVEIDGDVTRAPRAT